jgi:hypothetical protein
MMRVVSARRKDHRLCHHSNPIRATDDNWPFTRTMRTQTSKAACSMLELPAKLVTSMRNSIHTPWCTRAGKNITMDRKVIWIEHSQVHVYHEIASAASGAIHSATTALLLCCRVLAGTNVQCIALRGFDRVHGRLQGLCRDNPINV